MLPQKKGGFLSKTALHKTLSYRDSNPKRQNQNLLCYHYTIAQFRITSYASPARQMRKGVQR